MSELNIKHQWLLLSLRERSIIDTWTLKHIQIEQNSRTTNPIQNLHSLDAFPDYERGNVVCENSEKEISFKCTYCNTQFNLNEEQNTLPVAILNHVFSKHYDQIFTNICHICNHLFDKDELIFSIDYGRIINGKFKSSCEEPQYLCEGHTKEIDQLIENIKNQYVKNYPTESQCKETGQKLDASTIEPYKGISIVINDKTFTLDIENYLGGKWVVWNNPIYTIRATPNYEIDGIPFQIEKNGLVLHSTNYVGDITDVPTYFTMSRKFIEILLNDLEI